MSKHLEDLLYADILDDEELFRRVLPGSKHMRYNRDRRNIEPTYIPTQMINEEEEIV